MNIPAFTTAEIFYERMFVPESNMNIPAFPTAEILYPYVNPCTPFYNPKKHGKYTISPRTQQRLKQKRKNK